MLTLQLLSAPAIWSSTAVPGETGGRASKFQLVLRRYAQCLGRGGRTARAADPSFVPIPHTSRI